MALLDSLMSAIVRADGDALVMHVGERPYVVVGTQTISISTHGLNLDAMTGMLAQLLSPDAHTQLEEFGAVEYKVPQQGEDRFSVVAARGGDDIWIEIRRRRPQAAPVVAPPEVVQPPAAVEPPAAVAEAAPAPASIAEPVLEQLAEPIVEPAVEPAPEPSYEPIPESVAVFAPEPTPIPDAITELTAAPMPVLAPELVSQPAAMAPEPIVEEPIAAQPVASEPEPAIEPAPAIEPEPASEPVPVEQIVEQAPNIAALAETLEDATKVAEILEQAPKIAALAETLETARVDEVLAEAPKIAALAEALETAPAVASVQEVQRVQEVQTVHQVQTVQTIHEVHAAPMSHAGGGGKPPAPAEPPARLDPIARVEPVEPVERVEPVEPSEPLEPVDRLEPIEPAPPVAPLTRTVRIEVPPRTQPSSRAAGAGTVDRLLRVAAARGASALFLTSESRPAIRVDGDLRFLDSEAQWSRSDVESAIVEIAPESGPESIGRDATEWIAEFEGVGRIRCTTFHDHRGPGVQLRMIAARAATAEQLGLSPEVQALATETQGLVLVTGPRASGKSTVLSALMDCVNRQRGDYVISLERQLRLVHDNRQALVSQREIRGGADAAVAAASAALRETPDVLVVDDLMSPQLVSLLLNAASEGVLVFVSITASSTAEAVERFIEFAPADTRQAIRSSMAESFRGAVGQVLLKKTGGGLAPAREVLLATAPVTRVIEEGQLNQLPLTLDSGKHGMVSLTDSLGELVHAGAVDIRDAFRKAPDRNRLIEILKRDGIDTSAVERLA